MSKKKFNGLKNAVKSEERAYIFRHLIDGKNAYILVCSDEKCLSSTLPTIKGCGNCGSLSLFNPNTKRIAFELIENKNIHLVNLLCSQKCYEEMCSRCKLVKNIYD